MTNQHPITPPPELVQQWWEETSHRQYTSSEAEEHVVSMAAQYGADQELEACCEWMSSRSSLTEQLRAVRRRKPPTLKEQALETLQRLSEDKYPCNYQEDSDWDTIRRALESIND